MKKLPSSPIVSVCLSSAHPLVSQQFHELLREVPIRITGELSQSLGFTDYSEVNIPAAEVYIVDSSTAFSAEPLINAIFQQYPEPKILVVGDDFTEEKSFRFLELGAKGLVCYAESQQLGKAVQSIAVGGYWVPREILAKFVDSILKSRTRSTLKASNISSREQEVLDLLLNNQSNKEIANKLNISERTVKFHVSNLLSKFGVQRRADLILLWFQNSPKQAISESSTRNSVVVM